EPALIRMAAVTVLLKDAFDLRRCLQFSRCWLDGNAGPYCLQQDECCEPGNRKLRELSQRLLLFLNSDRCSSIEENHASHIGFTCKGMVAGNPIAQIIVAVVAVEGRERVMMSGLRGRRLAWRGGVSM